MQKKFKYLLLIIVLLLIFPKVSAKESVNLYLFWGDGCPHCEAEQIYLKDLEKDFDNLRVIKYEVWHNENNNQFMRQIASETNENLNGVPITIIGQTIISGFSDSTKQQIRRAINYYSQTKHHDIVKEIREGTYENVKEISGKEFIKEESNLSKKTTVELPFIKEVDFKNIELITAIPILGILASLSLPFLWLIITFASIISLQKEKKIRIKILLLGLMMIIISSLLAAILKINSIIWICKTLGLLICIFLVITQSKRLTFSDNNSKIIPVISAIIIGWLTPAHYWNILNEIIKSQSLSVEINILSNIYFFVSSLIPYILILLIFRNYWKKISPKKQKLIRIFIWIITIPVIIFI